jgi:C-terminal processing protease CtpA/Prc
MSAVSNEQLADEKHMAPNFLGAHLRDWYEAKYRLPLVRAKESEEGEGGRKLVKRRSALPYQGLSLMADPSQADLTLMNEAKVALRRALKMEGVGIMVRRNPAGQYVVATVMPGSPASIGGKVETDDVILAVGGVETDGMTPQQLADAVLGPQGSRVSVTLRRAAVQTGQVDGESQRLERVYTLDLIRSDKPIVAPNSPEIAAAERYASSLASKINLAP